jgi:hypothetical protein
MVDREQWRITAETYAIRVRSYARLIFGMLGFGLLIYGATPIFAPYISDFVSIQYADYPFIKTFNSENVILMVTGAITAKLASDL